MTRWRLAIGLLLFVFLGVPLGLPFVRLFADPVAWGVWTEADRLLSLARNTAYLTLSVVAITVPLGTAAAVLLHRTDLPLRRTFRFLTILALFIPLPLFASGWQAALGSGGWLPLSWWNPPRPGTYSATAPGGVWAAWGQGVGSAIWIHAAASLPWVILVVGQGLRGVERELEEDALTAASRWRVLFAVTLRRSAAAIGAAALWVGLQAATEITITDMVQVRTYAEEVYTQMVAPEADAQGAPKGDMVARSVAASAPLVLGMTVLVVVMTARWERTLPPRATASTAPLYPLGWTRWPLCAAAAVVCLFLLAAPLGALVGRAGLQGTPPNWSVGEVGHQMVLASQNEGVQLVDSLILAAAAGAVSAGLALFACWAALGAPRFRYAVLILMAVAWATPGPIVGLGMKQTILAILDATHSPRLLLKALWAGPSPAPLLWVDVIRFFPYAVVVLWPVVRLTPPELRDAARVDGAAPLQEFWYVICPLHAAACLQAAAAAAVLSLGEVSAGKLVCTPGWTTFADEVWVQMHYGVKSHLAAMCLWMLGAVGAGAAFTAALGWYRSRVTRGK